MRRAGIGGHTRAHRGAADEWLTPPEILRELGPFDLDPCSPIERPWPTAQRHLTVLDDGLSQPWVGRVWLNPPYGAQIGLWMRKMAHHRHGIALTFARTETAWFHESVWSAAHLLVFLTGRLTFHRPDGSTSKYNAGAPTVLVAYDPHSAAILHTANLPGARVGVVR